MTAIKTVGLAFKCACAFNKVVNFPAFVFLIKTTQSIKHTNEQLHFQHLSQKYIGSNNKDFSDL